MEKRGKREEKGWDRDQGERRGEEGKGEDLEKRVTLVLYKKPNCALVL